VHGLVGAMIGAVLLTGCVSVNAEDIGESAGPVARTYTTPTAAYARTIVIPSGYETIRLPGVVADPLGAGTAAAPTYGDTEQQTESVLAKIRASLAEAGVAESDVVAATVYLVAPSGSAAMDFAAMNRAWAKHYGSADQPNRPVRSTVEVAGLVQPGMLVEIEVTAMRKPR
jgi:enamine deaminase RidA (YjgF/YER057c/UK114 family)